jgi:hypothetical protein
VAAACSAVTSSVFTAVVVDGNPFASGVLFMGLGTLVMVSAGLVADAR